MGDAQKEAFHRFIGVVLCVKRHNTPEFMSLLADRINEACAACGLPKHVEWPPGHGNEFRHLPQAVD